MQAMIDSEGQGSMINEMLLKMTVSELNLPPRPGKHRRCKHVVKNVSFLIDIERRIKTFLLERARES